MLIFITHWPCYRWSWGFVGAEPRYLRSDWDPNILVVVKMFHQSYWNEIVQIYYNINLYIGIPTSYPGGGKLLSTSMTLTKGKIFLVELLNLTPVKSLLSIHLSTARDSSPSWGLQIAHFEILPTFQLSWHSSYVSITRNIPYICSGFWSIDIPNIQTFYNISWKNHNIAVNRQVIRSHGCLKVLFWFRLNNPVIWGEM